MKSQTKGKDTFEINKILKEIIEKDENKKYKRLATNHYEMGFDLLVIRMALIIWLNKYPIHRICKQDYIPLAKDLCEMERLIQEYSVTAGNDFKKIIADIKTRK